MAGTFTITTLPPFLTARTLQYTAWQLRNFMDCDPPGPGVADYESFRVKQRGAGADRSVDVGNISLNQAWIRGTSRGGLGLWRADNIDYTAPAADTYLPQINTGLIFSNGDPTNPRIDQVFLRILDQQHDGGGSNLLQAQVVDGTPTGGATLDNRTGVGATPANSILLADVLMPALATTVTTANIRDRRLLPLNGGLPAIPLTSSPTLVDAVAFQPPAGVIIGNNTICSQAGFDAQQAACLMYLPRRIVGATRIRWKYMQGATANNANYTIAIYDATGRQVATTGPVAYSGGATTIVPRSETITATTFEPGYYWVAICNAAALAASTCLSVGVIPNVSTGAGLIGVPLPNTFLRNAVGGAAAPNNLLGFADISGVTATTSYPGVPMVALSVG